MDERILQAAVKKILLHLSKERPEIIREMCSERKSERLKYIENHKEDYYLGNNERADLIMSCDFLTECFSQEDKKQWKKKLLNIMLDDNPNYLSRYDEVLDMYEDFDEGIQGSLELVRTDDVFQSILVLMSYSENSSNSFVTLNHNFTEFADINALEKTVEKRLNMKESFSECVFVKKGIKRLRQFIAEEIHISTKDGEFYASDNLANAFLDIILHTNGKLRCVPALNTATCCSLKSKYFEPFILYGYEKLVIDTQDEFQDYTKFESARIIVDEAINNACKAAILNRALYDFSDRIFKKKPIGVLATFPIEKEEEVSPNKILKLVKEIDISTLITSCTWNATFALMKEKMINNSLNALRYETDYDALRIKESESKLAKMNTRLDEANKEIESLKAKNCSLQKNLDNAKEDCSVRFKKEQQSDKNLIADMDRTIRKQQREIEKLKQQLENEKRKNENLENTTVVRKDEKEIKKCDFDKRYMFLCGHATLASRIAEAFPNSINSEGYNINEKNAKTIDAVVAITSEISHNEYERIKKQCIMHEIPFIHCSSVNIEKISEKIAEIL